jgi:hypothetical protein
LPGFSRGPARNAHGRVGLRTAGGKLRQRRKAKAARKLDCALAGPDLEAAEQPSNREHGFADTPAVLPDFHRIHPKCSGFFVLRDLSSPREPEKPSDPLKVLF